MRKKISILGSTGSVGVSTLQVIEAAKDQFEVVGLACGTNIQRLKDQIRKFNPLLVSVAREQDALSLKEDFPKIEITFGEKGVIEVATLSEVDLVVSALVGALGLQPTWAAIQAKKDIALANKEVLVSAGSIVMQEAKKQGVQILPVDSEHSAIFQALKQENLNEVEKIVLTASGGPFLNTPKEDFSKIEPSQALKHPSWKMGDRITIDSATMMNKGFEVIEAYWLFGLNPSQIEVVVHPQSIIHGLVNFKDGNVLSCLSIPDMKAPIAYALSYPNRIKTEVGSLDLAKVQSLTFQKPDLDKFPLLKLSFEVLKSEGLLSSVLNAADEIAVSHFLNHKIRFDQIAQVVEQTLQAYPGSFEPSLQGVFAADQWARQKALTYINRLF